MFTAHCENVILYITQHQTRFSIQYTVKECFGLLHTTLNKLNILQLKRYEKTTLPLDPPVICISFLPRSLPFHRAMSSSRGRTALCPARGGLAPVCAATGHLGAQEHLAFSGSDPTTHPARPLTHLNQASSH